MQSKMQTFEQFLTTQSTQINMWAFLMNLLIAAGLSMILSRVYVKYGRSLSNRRQFSLNFVLLAVTTMLIITVVKSSLALSLGLVGALSIVRFRSAIKEPEELAYLFLNLAIGLGLGAGQTLITVVGFTTIVSLLVVSRLARGEQDNHNLYLSVTCDRPKKTQLDQIIGTLKQHCSQVNLRRFDETPESLEAAFVVEYDDYRDVIKSKQELCELDDSLRIVFVDHQEAA